MKEYFSISQGYTLYRPPISSKIKEYFVTFITENILKEKKIILGGKWRVDLTISFEGESRLGFPRKTTLDKSPRIVSSEGVKLYWVFVPVKTIQESENPLLKTIELMYEAISIFFTTTYKKVTSDFMNYLWKEVDLNYLLSLPYPAPIEDQKYTGDVIQPDGTVKNVVHRT